MFAAPKAENSTEAAVPPQRHKYSPILRLRQGYDLGGSMSKKSKPLVLINGKARSERLRNKMLHERPDTVRAMKKSRQDDIIALAIAFIELCCLQLEGVAVALSNGTARPITVPELTRMAKLNQRTCERCLADMKDMGLIHVTKQTKSKIDRGEVLVIVSSVLRALTPKFWDWLGLLEDFRRAVQWAKSKLEVIKLRMPTFRKPCHRVRGKSAANLKPRSLEEQLAPVKCRRYITGRPCLPGHCAQATYEECMKFQKLGWPAMY